MGVWRIVPLRIGNVHMPTDRFNEIHGNATTAWPGLVQNERLVAMGVGPPSWAAGQDGAGLPWPELGSTGFLWGCFETHIICPKVCSITGVRYRAEPGHPFCFFWRTLGPILDSLGP